MYDIYELATKNGKKFRVSITNKSQKKRFLKVISENKNKNYEIFTSVKLVLSGIHGIKVFEEIAKNLI